MNSFLLLSACIIFASDISQMMIRKFTTLSFLSLACLVILAFTVLPHHHHAEYICFTVSHCACETTDGPQAQDSNHHTHGHGCVKSLLQTQVSRNQSLEHACKEGHCVHFLQLTYLLPDLQLLSFLHVNNLPFSGTFYREKFHPVPLISPTTGRAPPGIFLA